MRFILLLTCLLCGIQILGQEFTSKGQRFWLGFMENLTLDFNGPPEFALLVDADDSGTAVVIAPVTGFTFSLDYVAGVNELPFPEGVYYSEGSDVVGNFGLRIETTTSVSIAAIHYRIYFSEASVILPEASLSSDYRLICAEDFDGTHASEFVVIATEDNTTVEITPSATTLALYPAFATYAVTLDEGESYQVQSLGNLTGSRVEAPNGELIAAFSGAMHAQIACSSADNHMWDQAIPVRDADTTFAVIPFANQDFSSFAVLAHVDETTITLGGDPLATLDAGESFVFEEGQAKALFADKPVSLSYLKHSQICSELGDPNMLAMLSLGVETTGSHFKSLTSASNGVSFTENWVTVVAHIDASSSVTLDGEAPAEGFIELPGAPGYVYANILCNPGENSLICPEGCQAWAYGYGDYDAYTYHLDFEVPEPMTSVAETTIHSVAIWPNPSKGLIQVRMKAPFELEILDIGARMVWRENGVGSEVFDLSMLPKGSYLGVLTSEGQRSVTRITLID